MRIDENGQLFDGIKNIQNNRIELIYSNPNMMRENANDMNSNNHIKIIIKRNEKQSTKNIIIGKNLFNKEEDIEMKEDAKIERNKK